MNKGNALHETISKLILKIDIMKKLIDAKIKEKRNLNNLVVINDHFITRFLCNISDKL